MAQGQQAAHVVSSRPAETHISGAHGKHLGKVRTQTRTSARRGHCKVRCVRLVRVGSISEVFDENSSRCGRAIFVVVARHPRPVFISPHTAPLAKCRRLRVTSSKRECRVVAEGVAGGEGGTAAPTRSRLGNTKPRLATPPKPWRARLCDPTNLPAPSPQQERERVLQEEGLS